MNYVLRSRAQGSTLIYRFAPTADVNYLGGRFVQVAAGTIPYPFFSSGSYVSRFGTGVTLSQAFP